MKKIAIFASGAGTNAGKIIQYFNPGPSSNEGSKPNAVGSIALIVCNKPGAEVLKIALQHSIPSLIIEKEKFFRGNAYVDELKAAGIDFLVLAGFLWKIPVALVKAFPKSIINIHPALLPKYGGKGMYGIKVHEAVMAAGEKESGITIHYVDEQYDKGDIIYQLKYRIVENETPESLALSIQMLEHVNYPLVIESLFEK